MPRKASTTTRTTKHRADSSRSRRRLSESLDGDAASGSTRQRILAEAAQLFREKGYDGATMDELARRVGITAAALYWHFPSKQEILVQTLADDMLTLIGRAEAAAKQASPEAALREFVRGTILFNLERQALARLYVAANYTFPQLVSALEPEQRARFVAIERKHVNSLKAMLQRGVDSGDFAVPDDTATTFAIVALTEHIVHWYRPGGRLSPDAVADLYADYAIRIVRAA